MRSGKDQARRLDIGSIMGQEWLNLMIILESSKKLCCLGLKA